MADVLKITSSQLAIASPVFTDDKGNVVDNKTLSLAFDSADSAVAAWEKRDAQGNPAPDGLDAIVAKGLGTAQVHCTATNPDGTTAIITGDVEVVAKDAIAGSMNFGPAMEQP